MAQTYNLDQLIVTSTAANFEKRLENELVIGRLAKKEFKDGKKLGDEVKITMPGEVTLSKWDGGDLKAPEAVKASVVRVPIDQGRQINFELEQDKALQIINAESGDVAAKLAAEYSSDAVYKTKDEVDAYMGGLYPLAGHVETNTGGAAIELTSAKADNAFKILANVKAKLSRLNTWKTGKMLAILPPEMIAIMLGMSFNQYTESQVKDRKTGELSQKVGFTILESNNIAKDNNNNFYPLFGVEGGVIAAPIQKSLKLIPYMRDESINHAYKDGFIFGGSVPNSKKLATAKVTCATNSYS